MDEEILEELKEEALRFATRLELPVEDEERFLDAARVGDESVDEMWGPVAEVRTSLGRAEIPLRAGRTFGWAFPDDLDHWPPLDDPLSEGGERARTLARRALPALESRGFEAREPFDNGRSSISWTWAENPGPDEVAIAPNFVTAWLDRESGVPKKILLADYPLEPPFRRTEPVAIESEEARELARERFGGEGEVTDLDLLQDIEGWDEEVRTVYRVELLLETPMGTVPEGVEIDADTGEILED